MRLTFGMMLLALSGIASAQTPEWPASGGVCARLAPQIGLKPEPANSKEPATWRAGLFGFGATLFGGSAGVTFMAQPIEGTTQEQLTESCKPAKTDIVCNLTGPVRVVVGTKKGEASTDLAPGERAEIGTKGKHIFCREA